MSGAESDSLQSYTDNPHNSRYTWCWEWDWDGSDQCSKEYTHSLSQCHVEMGPFKISLVPPNLLGPKLSCWVVSFMHLHLIMWLWRAYICSTCKLQVLVALYENYILSSGQLYTWLLSCMHIECPGDLRGLFAQHCMIIREATFNRYWWWYYSLISRAEWFQPFVHALNLNACQSRSSQSV